MWSWFNKTWRDDMDAESHIRMALADRCMSDEKIDEMLNQYFQDRLAVLMDSRDATTCISASTLFRQGNKEE